MMNLFLLILLFSLFILCAIGVYFFYICKSRLFDDIYYLCKYLKNNISFNKRNINELLTLGFQDINKTSANILKNLSSPMSKLILRKDIRLINDFFRSLGKGDVSFEINNLDYYLGIFESIKNTSKEEIKTKGLLYFKLIIGLGLIVCVLLI